MQASTSPSYRFQKRRDHRIPDFSRSVRPGDGPSTARRQHRTWAVCSCNSSLELPKLHPVGRLAPGYILRHIMLGRHSEPGLYVGGATVRWRACSIRISLCATSAGRNMRLAAHLLLRAALVFAVGEASCAGEAKQNYWDRFAASETILGNFSP